MENNNEFLNIYLEKMSGQVGELSKIIILKDSHIAYLETINKRLVEENAKLTAKLPKNKVKPQDDF